MATPPSPNHAERAMSKLDAQLTCGVCLDRYTDPRTLPCHHIFCKKCIDPLPVELDNNDRSFIKCPLCQTLTSLSEDRAFSPAFHVNNLLEIDEQLNKTEPVQVCPTHNKPRDIFCETCDQLICLRCIEAHHAHQYSSAAELYEKHKCEIEACLKQLKKRTDEVEKIMQSYKVRDEEIAKVGKAAKAKIDKSGQQQIESLLKSKNTLGKKIDSIIREKHQLNRCQKGEVEAVFAQLKSCHELVEEELGSRSQHQIQEARKQLIELIYNTMLEAKVGELQPAQIADISFEPNQMPPDLGNVRSSMCYSAPGIFTVHIPELVAARIPSRLTISSPVLFSSDRLSCRLFRNDTKKASSSWPLMCPVIDSSPSLCTVEFRPRDHGSHQLSIQMDGRDIHGSPFPFFVASIPDARGQSLKIFAEDLNSPCDITVSEDGKLVLVAEWNGHSVRVLSSSGEEMGKVDAKFKNPWGVALSTDNHIYVADANKVRKFSPSGALIKSIKLCTSGIAINRQTEILYFVNWDKRRVDVVNSNLQEIQSFSERLEQPRDIAIDKYGAVYITDSIKHKVVKFAATGKYERSIGDHFARPHGICIDLNNIMYVTDREKNCVMVLTTYGEYLGRFSTTGLQPRGIAVDRTGKLYVCDITGKVFVSSGIGHTHQNRLEDVVWKLHGFETQSAEVHSKVIDVCVPHGAISRIWTPGDDTQPSYVHSDVRKYQKEVKQLQRELAEGREMLHARDVTISDLEWENSQMQNKFNLMKAQLLSENKELQHFGSGDWVIALQAASSTFSEQDQQSLFDMLKAIRLQSGSTVDTAVQADYLAVAPDFLRGVEVSGETVLEFVGDKPQKLNWPGYGFYIEVPEGALPPGVTASVGVKIIMNGQFKLPENSQLISAVYWISSSVLFLKTVAVNIQHCAVIRSEEQCSKCKFIIAKCSQEVLPYSFKEKEGLFNAHTQYATIKLKQFSLVGATGPEDTELRYMGLKFYKPIPHTVRVDFIFVVIRNLEAELKSVTSVYSDCKEDKQMQMIVFKKDEITLDLPCDPIVVNNWKLLPLTYPKIAKVDVERFQAGTRPPACNIELEWTGGGEQQELFHRVKIIGAEEPNNYFQMRYYPHAMDTPVITHDTALPTQTTSKGSLGVQTPLKISAPLFALDAKPGIDTLTCLKYTDKQGKTQRIYIMDEIGAKWKRVGRCLKFSISDLDNIESTCHGDAEECSVKLFTLWLQGHIEDVSNLPITWETLLEALKDARMCQLADKLTHSCI